MECSVYSPVLNPVMYRRHLGDAWQSVIHHRLKTLLWCLNRSCRILEILQDNLVKMEDGQGGPLWGVLLTACIWEFGDWPVERYPFPASVELRFRDGWPPAPYCLIRNSA
ncbi:hypothetical protein AVEN_54623-1 [Araneus ventricosus]|uniref:Uncharacterized protein n=1 Tax=Araneus ventricosus TaxID=182803 RepID=A0A4Y2BM07_ARAVE|nr:hypothetical protein AVEN_54623-1 [Araneus ventricosus]